MEEAARASEFRVHLELTERTESTLRVELEEQRRRREEAERERDELAAKLASLKEHRGSSQTVAAEEEGAEFHSDTGEAREGEGETVGPRSWWRRFFGFE
jgi:hypothetical protein